jgi:hypothetical protein
MTAAEYVYQPSSKRVTYDYTLYPCLLMHINTSTGDSPRSKERMGVGMLWSQIFTVQSAEHDRNTLGWKGFHFTPYIAIW